MRECLLHDAVERFIVAIFWFWREVSDVHNLCYAFCFLCENQMLLFTLLQSTNPRVILVFYTTTENLATDIYSLQIEIKKNTRNQLSNLVSR